MEDGTERTAMERFMLERRIKLFPVRFFSCEIFRAVFIIAFVLVSSLLFEACISKNSVPYEIFGEINLSAENSAVDWSNERFNVNKIEGLDNARLEFVFTNLSDKRVESFTIIIFVLDEDGNSLFFDRNNLFLKIDDCVFAGESYSGCINITEYFSYIPDEVFEIEYIYVKRIEYDDGSFWGK